MDKKLHILKLEKTKQASITKAFNIAITLIILTVTLLVALFAFSGCTSNTGNENDSTNAENVQDAVPSAGINAQKSNNNSNTNANSNSDVANSGATNDSDSMLSSADSTLTVRFLDVGQGDCALITCGGESLLIDGGPPSASSKVYSVLKTLNLQNLNYIVASHPDSDHIGGISGALTYAGCNIFYCSSDTSDTSTFLSMKSKLAGYGKSITVPNVGDSFTVGSAIVTFVGPVQQSEKSENNNSLVLRIDHGSQSFLFTGDAEKEAESAMVKKGANVKANVLKVAHHGSKSSSSASFLRAVSPQIAVISVGSNSYGHPTSKVIEALQKVGAQVLRTDEVGSIIMKSDGNSITQYTTKGEISE